MPPPAQLSDFGLVKLLTEQEVAAGQAAAAEHSTSERAAVLAATERGRRRRFSGTITHSAPEAIQAACGA